MTAIFGASAVNYLIRDRDSKYTPALAAALADSGITAIITGIRIRRVG